MGLMKHASFVMLLLVVTQPTCFSSRVRRKRDQLVDTELAKTKKKCTITGPRGEKVSWAVKSCRIECTQATDWEGESTLNQIKQFASAFHVTYVQGRCVCSHDGHPLLQFAPRTKTRAKKRQSWDQGATAEHCEADDKIAKEYCWSYYKAGRATNITMHESSTGDSFPIAKKDMALYRNNNFAVHKDECPVCDGDDCTEAVLPHLIGGLTSEVKAKLLATILAAKEGGGSGALKEFAQMLVDTDIDDLRFAQMDTDGNGELDLDELCAAYPGHPREEIEAFMRKADVDGNGSISLEEFRNFRKFFYVKWEVVKLRCVNSVNGEEKNHSECLRTYDESKGIAEKHINSLILD